MATISAPVAATTSITITLTSLASATYVASSAVDLTAIDPLDVVIELIITPGVVTGNKQAKVFVVVSLDGTNYTSGPNSGTSIVDEQNLYFLGVLPLNTASTIQRGVFSFMAAPRLGFVPPHFKLVVFNDSGVAFAASACSANYSTIVGNSA